MYLVLVQNKIINFAQIFFYKYLSFYKKKIKLKLYVCGNVGTVRILFTRYAI